MNAHPASPRDSTEARAHDAREAGAYGFSRAEIGALLVLVVIVAAMGLLRWWQRQRATATLPWVVENVVVESAQRGKERRADSLRRVGSRARPAVKRAAGVPLDINTAPVSELARLPGIGPTLAQRIAAERTRGGPFQSLRDLRRVNGIGEKKAAGLAGWVTFSINLPVDSSGS